MSRVVITTVPAAGHVRPMAPIAHDLVAAGHEVIWYGGRRFQPAIERTGASFIPITADLPFDPDGDALERGDEDRAATGLRGLRKVVYDTFVASIPAYACDLADHLDELTPDVVLTDHTFTASPLLARRRGIPVVVLALGPLAVSSRDTAPFGTGLAPSSSTVGRLRNRALAAVVQHIVFRRAQASARRIVADMGDGPFPGFFADWSLHMADRYLQLGAPEFEYPRTDLPRSIDFIGITDQRGIDSFVQPDWWSDLAEAKANGVPVVVTTQGSASTAHERLLLPTVAALAERDVLHIATTVTRDPDDVLPVDLRPSNLRLERFVPFPHLLPHADVLVTNGGYGGVQTALSFGVPLVVSGRTEDKMETNARVRWTGTGISVDRDDPTPADLERAVVNVLSDPSYRIGAERFRGIYARYGGAAAATAIVAETAGRGRWASR